MAKKQPVPASVINRPRRSRWRRENDELLQSRYYVIIYYYNCICNCGPYVLSSLAGLLLALCWKKMLAGCRGQLGIISLSHSQPTATILLVCVAQIPLSLCVFR